MLRLSSIKRSSSTGIVTLFAASFLMIGCASTTPPPRDCPPIVVPAKYKTLPEPLDIASSNDDADALDVITGNYAKYILLDIRYRSLLDWAEGLNKEDSK